MTTIIVVVMPIAITVVTITAEIFGIVVKIVILPNTMEKVEAEGRRGRGRGEGGG